jgi:hypothetical protein
VLTLGGDGPVVVRAVQGRWGWGWAEEKCVTWGSEREQQRLEQSPPLSLACDVDCAIEQIQRLPKGT